MLAKTLTSAQLFNACKNNRFILVRHYSDYRVHAINCGIYKFKRFTKHKRDQTETNYISFIPCNFMEYISNKVPFK